jgi:WD40 repeat protein
MRPGEHPVAELERALARAGDASRVVLAIDQFEETFTLCGDDSERQAFIAALVRLAGDREGRCVITVAVRGDFYARCAAFPDFSALLAANHVLVGAMTTDELRCAIEAPAARVGLRIEPELVDALVGDVEGEPGDLPLLSTALLELWRDRDGRWMRLASYEQSAGVGGAVARLAEDAFGRLTTAEQTIARQILLRLAGDGAGDTIVGRRLPLADFGRLERDDAPRVLAVLADRRLLTIRTGTVEVAHEALLREWPRLGGWLREDADARQLHRQLRDATRDWENSGRDPGDLYRGARLAAADEWRAAHRDELTRPEGEFLDAGRAAARRAQRRLWSALAGVTVLLLITALAAIVALTQRRDASAHAVEADAQRLGAVALSEPSLDRALLIAREAVARQDSPATRDSLLAVLMRTPAAIGVMRGDGDPVFDVDLRPGGDILAFADADGTVFRYAPDGRRQISRPLQLDLAADAEIGSLRFSPDGAFCAVTGWDSSSGFVDLIDAGTGRPIERLAAGLIEPVESLAFSPDSTTLLAKTHATGSASAQILRWDVTGPAPHGVPSRVVVDDLDVLGFVGRATVVTFERRSKTIALREARTFAPLRRLRVDGAAAELSPDGATVALAAVNGAMRFLTLRSGTTRLATGRFDAPVGALRFTRDGRRLVTAGHDGRITAWDVSRAAAVTTLETGSTAETTALAISDDGRTTYSASRDGSVTSWDLDGSRRLDRQLDIGQRPLTEPLVTLAANGDVMIGDTGGHIRIFDARTLRLTRRLTLDEPASIWLSAVAPDGRTAAALSTDGRLGFWDLETRQPFGPLRPAVRNTEWASGSFSDDGRWMVTGGADPLVSVWDMRRHTLAGQLMFATVADLSLSPDGTELAATVTGGGLEILSVPRLAVRKRVRMPAGVWGKFARDGRSFLYVDRQGRVWHLDTKTWKPRGAPLSNPAAPIRAADISPDGRLLATTSRDGSARLWDLVTRRPIGPALPGLRGDWADPLFLRDGTHLLVVHPGGISVWDVRPGSWKRRACAIAGRALTRAEWQSTMPGRPYAPACRTS